jgi:hypothetical protein
MIVKHMGFKIAFSVAFEFTLLAFEFGDLRERELFLRFQNFSGLVLS